MESTCPRCYNKCREGAKFCSKCGHNFIINSFSELPPTAPLDEAFFENPLYPCKNISNTSLEPVKVDELKIKARKIVKVFAVVAGTLTIMWLPFLDILYLVPLQCYMVMTIAGLFGQKLSFEMAKELLMTCFAASVGFIGAYACGNFIPYIGKFLTAPIIFACTYGVGDVAVEYFSQEGKLSKAQMKDIYKHSFESSKNLYRNDVKEAEESLEHIKEYLSPDEYEKIKKKFI